MDVMTPEAMQTPQSTVNGPIPDQPDVLAVTKHAALAAKQLHGLLLTVAKALETQQSKAFQLEFENEALKRDNLEKGREIDRLEDEVLRLQQRMPETVGTPPLSTEADVELFYQFLSQTPREWYWSDYGPRLDLVITEHGRKKVVTVGPADAVAHFLTGKLTINTEEWKQAGFRSNYDFWALDNARMLQACGLSDTQD
jgi:hypothetical protein